MSRTANPVAVGAFVLGTLLLAVLLVVFFSDGRLFGAHERYVLLYDSSIKGLNVGAPVTIKGVKIGQVAEIKASMDTDTLSVLNTVTIEIDPDALERNGSNKRGDELMEDLIEHGLRAQLRLQSLLTGLLYVDVDFHPGKLAQYKKVKTAHKQIPTIPTGLEQLTQDLETIDVNKLGENFQQIVDGVNKLINDPNLQHMGASIEETLVSVRGAADQLRMQSARLETRLAPLLDNGDRLLGEFSDAVPQLTGKLDTTLAALNRAAGQLEQAAGNTTYLTSEDSPLLYRIDTAATNVNAAAEQVRRLTDMLERQPETLLFGKSEE